MTDKINSLEKTQAEHGVKINNLESNHDKHLIAVEKSFDDMKALIKENNIETVNLRDNLDEKIKLASNISDLSKKINRMEDRFYESSKISVENKVKLKSIYAGCIIFFSGVGCAIAVIKLLIDK